jgi:hypothetical protein
MIDMLLAGSAGVRAPSRGRAAGGEIKVVERGIASTRVSSNRLEGNDAGNEPREGRSRSLTRDADGRVAGKTGAVSREEPVRDTQI